MHFVHILVGSADPNSVNGVNKVVHWLATTQIEMGERAEIWAIKPDEMPAIHERSYDIRIFGTTRSRFILTPELRSALQQLPLDTWVQLHSVYVPELTSIAKLLKKRGISYGVTTHGGYLSLYFDQSIALRLKKKLFATLWENFMLRHAAMIHVIGPTELADLERRAPGQKMVIIPNGYAPSQLEQPAGPRREMQPPSIMFCGRHEIKQKGLDILIRGFAFYRNRGICPHLPLRRPANGMSRSSRARAAIVSELGDKLRRIYFAQKRRMDLSAERPGNNCGDVVRR
jgi:glycosyltransferase involved in cell wall biosynthesis